MKTSTYEKTLENVIYVRNYSNDGIEFPVNYKEIWRYSGYMGVVTKDAEPEEELKSLLEEVVAELKDTFSYKVCYRRMPLIWENDKPVLPWMPESKALNKCLTNSSEIVIFAATIGLEIDRRIKRYQHLSPTKALLMQAYGAERVEALCDYFCNEIQEQLNETKGVERIKCTPRFSPGYGDLALEVQKDFFSLLDCNRKIGISLGESLLMTPSKSVTAIFGIRDCDIISEVNGCITDEKNCKNQTHNCSACDKTDCEFRVI